MTEDVSQQIDASVTPGTMLKAAREARELSEREAADMLNWMPNYVEIIERDDYQSLRSPAFARGYVKAYARLLDLDQDKVLLAFDNLRSAQGITRQKRIETRPLQLQPTGLGVIVGLAVLFLLGLILWWGQREPVLEPPRDVQDAQLNRPALLPSDQHDSQDSVAGER